jgi:phosphoribosylamine--glycine ligase
VGQRVLVVGGGGREHALAWTLVRSPQVDEVLVAPGNAGTATESKCRNVGVGAADLEAIVALALGEQVDLVVVGPEDPLVAGLVDRLTAAGIRAFGPSAAAARLEGSKAHCKDFLLRHGIPTGAAATFTDAAAAIAHLDASDAVPVIKASGLAAGKGVIVAETRDEAAAAITDILVDRRFGDAGTEVLLEERLHGPEVSILAFCDGVDFHVMPAAQDHKRLGDGDVGPNTGGMGAFHPSPIADDALLERVGKEVIAPTLQAMVDEGRPYRGVLYAGMMLTADGPKVIEFNCRFGDPETQVVLPLLESDLVDVCNACIDGTLATTDVRWSGQAAVTVVMASAGYPVSGSSPVPITGLESVADAGCTVFHAGTADVDGVPHTAGGRVLAVTAVRDSLGAAADAAHAGVALIEFDGAQHRTDIARATAEVRQ